MNRALGGGSRLDALNKRKVEAMRPFTDRNFDSA